MTDSDKIAFINEHKDKYRAVLQVAGTEYRRAQDENYWVSRFTEKAEAARAAGKVVVCDDCRFPNERGGGMVDVWVHNWELPEEPEGIKGHASEAMGPEGAEWFIHNYPSFGLEPLYDKLESIHSRLRGLGPNRRGFEELQLSSHR